MKSKENKSKTSREAGYSSHDSSIEKAKDANKFGDRTDAYAEGVGYLGVDDLDRIRRRKLR